GLRRAAAEEPAGDGQRRQLLRPHVALGVLLLVALILLRLGEEQIEPADPLALLVAAAKLGLALEEMIQVQLIGDAANGIGQDLFSLQVAAAERRRQRAQRGASEFE